MILKQSDFNVINMFKEWKREGTKRSYEMAFTRKKKTRKT
jgi:hypothetical protein